jgi:hypothetical protein
MTSRKYISAGSESVSSLFGSFKKATTYSSRHRIINTARRHGFVIEFEYVDSFTAHIKIGNDELFWDIRKSNPVERTPAHF